MQRWDDAFFRTAAEQAPAPLVVADLDGRVVYANAEATRLVGAPIVGTRVEDLVGDEHASVVSEWFGSIVRGHIGRSVYLEALPVQWAGQARWVDFSGRVVRSTGFRGVVLTPRDVSEYVDMVEQVRSLATIDSLTGLPNRRAFLEALERAVGAPAPVSLLLMDVDGLKGLNDRRGHSAGDAALCQVARAIEDRLPVGAVAGRLGGDEFVVLLGGHDVEQASRWATSLQRDLVAVEPLPGMGEVLSVSVGVAEVARDPDRALAEADAAMYRAKNEGRSRVVRYDPSTRTWAQRRHDLIVELRGLEAIVEQERRRAEAAEVEARTDDGTGLPNRRRLLEDLEALDRDARGAGSTYCLVFLDLDHFGKLNHERGDHGGDLALQRVAAVLTATMRWGEAVYRKGGEELVVLLPCTDLAGGLATAERYRRSLEAAAVPHEGLPDWPVVTASVGVAQGPLESAQDLLRIAGLCMLDAKAAGRNRVSCAPLRLPADSV